MATLKERLLAEQSKLARISEKSHAQLLAIATMEREVASMRSTISTELQAAVLEEREVRSWIAQLEDKLERVAKLLDLTLREQSSVQIGLRRQRSLIQSIEGEILAGRHDEFMRATLVQRQKIRAMIENLCSEMAAYDALGAEYFQDWGARQCAIFPFDVHGYPPQARNFAVNITWNAVNLARSSDKCEIMDVA